MGDDDWDLGDAGRESTDGSSRESTTETIGKKGRSTLWLRFKKRIASGAADSVVGRNLIVQSLGPYGEDILIHIVEALALFYGEAKALEMQTDLLKVALKTKLLFDDHLLTPKELTEADKPFRDFCFQAMKDLEFDEDDRKESKVTEEVSVDQLHESLVFLRDAMVSIYVPLIKPKNVEKIRHLFINFGDKSFLKALLNKDEYAETRNVLRKGLEPMTLLIDKFDEAATTARQVCKAWKCTNYEVKSKGLFRGTGLCAKHHLDRFGAVAFSPDVEIFLTNKFLAVHFLDFLQNHNFWIDEKQAIHDDKKDGTRKSPATHALLTSFYHFYDAGKQYQQIGSKNLRISRATQIKRKYLVAGATRMIALPERIQGPLMKAIGDNDVHKVTFDEAIGYAMDVLTKVFPAFVASLYYERAVVSVTLPEDAVDVKVEEYRKSLMGRPSSTSRIAPPDITLSFE